MPTLLESLTYKPSELSFGTSGLRGLVTSMTDLECYINTRGFLRFLEADQQLAQGSEVCLAGDLRDSTPRILQAVHQAITDSGYKTVYCGLIPTPALAFYALQAGVPGIMVTGSHIPADRNGIKFYKHDGEVLKPDEQAIQAAVAEVRMQTYNIDVSGANFTTEGSLTAASPLPELTDAARLAFLERYTSVFDSQTFAGKKVVLYQHSAVGRDLYVELFQALGAEVVPVGRSDVFVPIDTENVTQKDQAYFLQLSRQHPDAFAIISTDGDSDRPFVIDEKGNFHRGDVLGAIIAIWLEADFAAVPISSSDAVEAHLKRRSITVKHTKIGSPYVVVAMQEAANLGSQRVVGWEVNGGFLLGCDLALNDKLLKALPTRDAALPIIGALLAAVQQNLAVSKLFAQLPQRYTQAGLINNFPPAVSKAMIVHFSDDNDQIRAELGEYFSPQHGFGAIMKVDTLDGARIFFSSGEVAHLRPSGNAPQLRIYSVANTQERANEIVQLAIAEPDGIFRQLEHNFAIKIT